MSTTAQYPDRLLNLSDWERLPTDERHHVELAEGVLVVAPKSTPRHQIVMGRLFALLAVSGLPPGLTVTQDAEVVLSAGSASTVRAPDVLVVDRNAASTAARFAPAQVHLAVEIISTGSRTTDRVTKLAEYAAAGIAEYWIVDHEAPSLSTFVLTETSVYRQTGTYTGVATVETCGAVVSMDLQALTLV